MCATSNAFPVITLTVNVTIIAFKLFFVIVQLHIFIPVANRNMETKPNLNAKEQLLNQSSRSDSGIFSATANSTFPEEAMDSSAQANVISSDTDNRSDCSSPDQKYFCPICKTMLTSQHDFTVHIRLHNSDNEIHDDKGFVCRICKKKLSSSSSLDRHVLVHSGERPFSCKYCGDTFTTNGNMHRHIRTHSNKGENYESDGSTDSNSSRQTEYNNNKVEAKNDNKRKLEDAEDLSKKLKVPQQNVTSDETQHYKCPVCQRTDFASLRVLETHFEDNHPDYPVTCSECNIRFQNSKSLSHHRNAVHLSEDNGKSLKNCITGFKDLTFVDFSSEKFPHIARYQCEKSLHKVSGGLKFQCQKCSHAFPCSASLDIHERDCSVGLDLSVKTDNTSEPPQNTNLSEIEIRKVDFFGRLDLQNNSPEKNESRSVSETPAKLQQHLLESAVRKTIDSSKDLADIQSIISMTSNGSLLQQLCQKPTENSQLAIEPQADLNKSEQEEESQDVFATEFRKMKLRGEFPCRLCTAVFPNLRALKGHNRTHLNGMNNGTYRCNMCPHSSVDKAALIRHMRTHNGDRPYECSLCNYAFTTKANCERHLRNRHGKNTRDEVKKSIIYHPSEDPTNDEINKLSLRDEQKKGAVHFPTDNVSISPEKLRSSTPKLLHANIPETVNALKSSDFYNDSKLHKEPLKPYSNISDLIHSENIKSLKEHRLIGMDQMSPFLSHQYGYASKDDIPATVIPGKIHVKPLDALKKTPPFENSDYDKSEVEGVLDLSKKKKGNTEEKPPEQSEEDFPQDLSKKTANVPLNVGEILAQQLLKHNPHKIDPHGFYATQLALCRNGLNLPSWPPFSINPLVFQTLHSPLLTQDAQELKEKLQRIQLCGGNMINDSFVDRLKNLQTLGNANLSAFNGLNPNEPKTSFMEKTYSSASQEDLKPLTLNVESTYCDKMSSPLPQPKSDILQSPNSVKMVIKNGVLMPKQKQRRYRTERPFSCEHCAARFTLRSNMERHIKQQHPQFWSQRQRAGLNTSGRKSQTITTNMKGFCDINIPNYEVPKMHSVDKSDNHIDDKLKYAILAHHLRNSQNLKSHYNQETQIKREDDEDCDLIIDENDESKSEVKTETTEEHSADEAQHIRTPNILEEKLKQLHAKFENRAVKTEEAQDLVPVSRLLDNASQQQFKEYFRRDGEEPEGDGISEEDEEGLVASGSTSEGNNSGTDENR